MEYVDTYLHLGHVISNNLDDENDIIRAQGQFVGQVNNVLCCFRQLDCRVVGLESWTWTQVGLESDFLRTWT